MRDRPAGLGEEQLTAALRESWGLQAAAVDYLPVGAGSYHWSVVDRRGGAWFVKVDDLGVAGFDDLRRSYGTASALHRDAGLGFVVPPIPTTDGAVVRRLTSRYAVTVFPMIDGAAGDFGPHRREDLVELADLLAALHRATPAVEHLAPRTDLRLPGRDRLLEALHALDRPWTAGPHAEPARALLTRHRARILRRLADFDTLVDTVRDTPSDWVVTHGEPHPGNVLRTAEGLRLIDWTTVQIAPPERDLWMLTPAFSDVRGSYPAGVSLYRLWWTLADIAAFTGDLRRPHGDGEDAAAALTFLTGCLEAAAD